MLNSEYKFEKGAIVFHFLQTIQNLVLSRCLFAEKGKEMYQERKNTRVQPLFCSLTLLFSGIAVAILIFLNSLMVLTCRVDSCVFENTSEGDFRSCRANQAVRTKATTSEVTTKKAQRVKRTTERTPRRLTVL